ncbi:MAG: lipoprotein-releasing system transmembrane subunit LolC, partial [Candidatus Omnitrophota bacterium]|nr:lipoprotein-releasing system transmembrane subunit LolC [Candidatus Omnitrophota bacterium]
MKTELFISWRYLITKRKEKFISLISIISILGIAIGVMALIVVIAVMTGFDKDLR